MRLSARFIEQKVPSLKKRIMAIQLTDKIHTVSADIDTTNRGSAQANAGREAYTLQDVSDLIGGGGGAVDSIVAGSNIKISSATGNVTINAAIGGNGTTNQLALFTASGTIGNSLLAANTSGGINSIFVGSASAPVNLLIPAASRLVLQKQVSAPSSASTAGDAGAIVAFFNTADPADAANGLYVCTNTGVAGSASWSKAALTAV
jgi:hypothetical protein